MTRRFTVFVLVLVLAVALVAAGCANDSESETTTTAATTTESDASSGDNPTNDDDAAGDERERDEGGDTSGPVSDDAFDAAVADPRRQLESAPADDVCEIFGAFALTGGGDVPDPSNPRQTEQAVIFLQDWLIAIADAAEAQFPAEAATVRSTAAQIYVEAQAANFDPEIVSGSDSLPALVSPEFEAAGDVLFDECFPSEPMPTG